MKLLKKYGKDHHGDAGNIALVVIDYGDNNPHLIPGLFLSKGCFEKTNSHLKNQKISTEIKIGTKKIPLSLPLIPVYNDKKGTELQEYIDHLKSTLLSYKNLNHILHLCFCKILHNEIENAENKIKKNKKNIFGTNWYHSEQGFLQWLNSKASSIPALKTGTSKYRIFILTYRDMCLRCSSTLFSAKQEIEKLFGNNPVEIFI